jgi:ABC-type transport system involved in cytochrome c biogenesis permease subunit
MNYVEPFWYLSFLYLVGFVVSALGWLGWSKVFNRAAFAIVTTTFVLHALAIGWRIYITERPPVINLYSSAVFIAAAVALFGIIFEWIYKLGVGNVAAGIAGFGSLYISHILSLQGDHIESLQAVLDTQFWLTTHVVCITLGYAVTYLAGLLGTIYVIWSLFPSQFPAEVSKEISRMIYGILCFALVFSFFGTVLGGLWADDSWGRFWGWDPKENGALIIVLWNALVLHARWDGMVKERGLAVLAVAGNITTSWSWFGVNQLGVGLHAYGFSQELLNVLAAFVAVSGVIVLLGLIPRRPPSDMGYSHA